MADQLVLFDTPPTMPPGFRYAPEFVSPEAEQALVDQLAGLAFRAFEYRGYSGRRRVVSFGWRYDFSQQALHGGEPIPAFLLPLRDRAGAFAGTPPAAFEQVLVSQYPPGAAIGWHRDRPVFADVVGVSLLSPCRFRLRRRKGHGWERVSLTLERRSAYLLQGSVRRDWEHSIPPVDALRYSITFRTVRGRADAALNASSASAGSPAAGGW